MVLYSSAGGTVIGNFLYWVGFVLTFSSFYILYQGDIRKIIGGRAKPFVMAGSLMALGILLMIVGYYYPLIVLSCSIFHM